METLEAIGEEDEVFKTALRKWKELSQDQEFLRAYEARRKELLANKVIAHVREEGLEEGRINERSQIIKQMYDSGITPQTIANTVNVTLEEVQRILRLPDVNRR
ncbi:hypothetical protein [Bacillus wiedmannii]|uniref:hypothetical protein n=1 Tax=Bacillus wiedmannii TaxID=1890302 RepID=UPI000BEF2AAA|nr:hypothetical protein [Bacillus wiedmannii]PEO37651.1 hypothetical protein CN555_17075 [Bacillus wiedmannii]